MVQMVTRQTASSLFEVRCWTLLLPLDVRERAIGELSFYPANGGKGSSEIKKSKAGKSKNQKCMKAE